MSYVSYVCPKCVLCVLSPSALPLVAAALLVTGTFGLALASRSWGAGAATGVGRNGVLGRSGGKHSSRSRAAGKFHSPPSSMIC